MRHTRALTSDPCPAGLPEILIIARMGIVHKYIRVPISWLRLQYGSLYTLHVSPISGAISLANSQNDLASIRILHSASSRMGDPRNIMVCRISMFIYHVLYTIFHKQISLYLYIYIHTYIYIPYPILYTTYLYVVL